MDPNFPNSSATPEPSAAISPVSSPVAAGGEAGAPVPAAYQPIPAAYQPVPGSAPPAAGVPFAAPQPGATPAPSEQPPAAGVPQTVDWEARAREAEAARQRDAAALQQAIAQAQRQQVEQQERAASQARIDQAYEVARTMDTDQGLAYIRRIEDQERAGLAGKIQQVQQQGQQQARQVIEQLAAPMYADHLARQHNLPPDLAAQLKTVPPQAMDALVPTLAATAQMRQQMQGMLQQQQLSQQAQQMQQSGAYSVGGTNAPAGGTPPNPTRPVSKRQRDYLDYMAATGRAVPGTS